MKIALTGSTGVLGSAILEQLLALGYQVRALVRSAQPAREGVEWCEGTLEDLPVLDHLVQGTDAIVHAAFRPMEAEPPAGRSVAEHFVQNNIAGTLRLVERAPATTHRQLIYVSSLAVYGNNPRSLPGADQLCLDEAFSLWPQEFYGGHKASLEKMVIAASGDPGMNNCVFRPGFVLGHYPDPARDYICKIVDEALSLGEIRTQLGCYVAAASDLAVLFCDALGDSAVRGKLYNTFDRWLDFRDLAPLIERATGRSIGVTAPVADDPGISNARLGERAPCWRTDAVLAESVAARCAGR